MILPIDKYPGGASIVAVFFVRVRSEPLGDVMRVPKLIVATFVAVNLLLLTACLFTLKQNLRLRGDVSNLAAMLTPSIGTIVPPLLGADWTGAPQAILYGQDPRPTLIYTFTRGCTYCQDTWQALRRFQALAPRQLRIIYVDTNQDLFTSKYLDTNGIGQSPLLIRLSSTVAVAYDSRAVPQLLLVDGNGRVQWSHIGELSANEISKPLSLIEHH